MIFRTPNFSTSRSALLWCLLAIVVLILALLKVPDVRIETSILELLPKQEQTPHLKVLQERQPDYSTDVIYVISGRNQSGATANARVLDKLLRESVLFSEIILELDTSHYGETYSGLLDYRFLLLTPEDYQEIEDSPESYILKIKQQLYSPFGLQKAASLGKDPFFTFSNYLESLADSKFDIYQGVALIEKEGQAFALIRTKVSNQLTLTEQNRLIELNKELKGWANQRGHEVFSAGLPLYNAMGTMTARQEVSTIGLLSVLAIFMIVIFCFRSIIALISVIIAVGFGICIAFTACLYLFDSIHLIAIVFGCSLIGVSVDYSFHYLAEFYGSAQESAQKKLGIVLPGISLGMLSSVLAFSSLSFAPFPGLKQISVFSAVGLVGAWLTVVMLFPYLLKNYQLKIGLPFRSYYLLYLSTWPRWSRKFSSTLVLVFVSIFVVAGVRFKPEDNIKNIEKPNYALKQDEDRVRQLVGSQGDSQFFVVMGESIEEMIDKEQRLAVFIQRAIEKRQISSYSMLSKMYPDAELQKANNQLLLGKLVSNGMMESMLEEIGMPKVGVESLLTELEREQEIELEFKDWLALMPVPLRQQFLGCRETGCTSVVRLKGIRNTDVLDDFAQDLKGVFFVDQVELVNEVFTEYRRLASYFICLAILGVAMLLSIVLGWRSALMIIFTPVLSIGVAIATLVISSSTFSVFNVLALVLVLGISLDYAIFQHLSRTHEATTALAVLMSLVTTLLAFGLLSFSSTAILHSFGLTISIGLIAAFLAAPLLPKKLV